MKIRYGSAMLPKHPRPWDPATGRPSDDQLMELLRGRLREIAPQVAAGSRVDDGMLVGRSWSWCALPNHTGRPSHFDIGFTVGSSPVIADCISGTGPLKEAVGQMLDVWAQTSAACFLQMLSSGPVTDTIVSAVIGYGTDASELRSAMSERQVLRELALDLPGDRPSGVKVYLHRTPTETTGEVRVNGLVDACASQRLAAMEWPAVKGPATSRFFAVVPG